MTTIYKSQAGADALRRRYRESIAAWPIPSDHLELSTREGSTVVVASGDPAAPPVVLLHGSGANVAVWRSDIDALAAHFRVYAVDIVGEPGGSSPSRPALDSDASAAWLDDVLDALGVTSASFVGMSLGGWIALDYTIRRPRRVSRLSLLCPGGIGQQTMGWMPKALLYGMFGRWGRRRTAAMVTGLGDGHTAAILDDVVVTFTHFNPRTERLPIFTDEQLSAISVPAQVIVGEDDVMFDSAETSRRSERSISRVTVTVLPDVGHAIVGQTERVVAFLTNEQVVPPTPDGTLR